MYMYNLIAKKRDNKVLEKEEIKYMIDAYVSGEIPDYQMSAMLMAIYLNGMNDDETFALTDAMAKSGDMVDLSAIDGIKVDKHSTGGVGDKTTLIISPIVASYGVKVAKMSGRGLGHTGGTIDKLESIPGFKTTLSEKEFFDTVKNACFSVIGQSGNLTPADKKIYALRDVTATVSSIPLIASSIMSKKIAAGSDRILLDVKMGSGAFMKDLQSAIKLSQTMVQIGAAFRKDTVALITDMDEPLGANIGNNLEVMEAVDVLSDRGAKDITHVCVELSANMLYLAEKGDMDKCRQMAKDAISNGSALKYLEKMVSMQGGDVSVIKDTSGFDKSKYVYEIKSQKDGYISKMNAEQIGLTSSHLGAGRLTKDDIIDYSAGIVICKKTGDKVAAGDTLAILHTNKERSIKDAELSYLKALSFSDEMPAKTPLIYAKVEKDKTEKYTIQ